MAQRREIDAEPEGDPTASLSGRPRWRLTEQQHPERPEAPRAGRRWSRRILSFFGPSALVALAIAVGHFFIGPSGDVPALDPVKKVNREADGLPTNAAQLYRDAIEAYTSTDEIDWDDLERVDEPDIRARFAAHLSRNGECLRRLEGATRPSPCLFKVARDEHGVIEVPDVLALRNLGRLLSARLALAASDCDLVVFERTLGELDRMGKHLSGQPTATAYLIGLAALGTVQEHLLEPLVWTKLSEAERNAYGGRVAAFCSPPPDLAEVFRFARDELCWNPGDRVRPKRVAGEIDRYMAPLLQLSDLPVEDQACREHPVRLEMVRLWGEKASGRDTLRSVAAHSIPLLRTLVRAVDLRVRLIATQRGNLTVASILESEAADGEWPENLADLGPMAVDLYSGEPLVYSVSGESFVLYSRGLDGDDDGGRHNSRFGEPPRSRKSDSEAAPGPDGDYVFWPLSARSDD